MKQRIKLAQALVHDPDLLFLDEPTNGMDPKGREEMLELIRDLGHNKNVNLILSSHVMRVFVPAGRDQREIFQLAMEQQAQIRHLRPSIPTLEDVFAKAVGEE